MIQGTVQLRPQILGSHFSQSVPCPCLVRTMKEIRTIFQTSQNRSDEESQMTMDRMRQRSCSSVITLMGDKTGPRRNRTTALVDGDFRVCNVESLFNFCVFLRLHHSENKKNKARICDSCAYQPHPWKKPSTDHPR